MVEQAIVIPRNVAQRTVHEMGKLSIETALAVAEDGPDGLLQRAERAEEIVALVRLERAEKEMVREAAQEDGVAPSEWLTRVVDGLVEEGVAGRSLTFERLIETAIFREL